MCLIAIIKLDIPRLEIYLAEIKNATGSGCRHIPVSPVHCLDTIYFYLKFGIIKKEAMTEITKFYFNPTLAHSCANCDSVRNVVSILAIYTLMLCRNPHKTLRYVNALQKIYSQTTPSQNFLLRTWVANAYVSANDDKAVALFDELTEAFQNEKDGYTTFMKLSYYALKVKVSQFKGNDSVLLNELKHVTSQCDKEGHKLVKVNTVAHLLNNYKPVENNNELFVNFYFDFVKTTRNSGCRPESFFVNAS